ncbi:phosphatase PAP2 family protein [Leptospira levettii]|uniref:phosphatase PAP2 family protein n=1 Tax=Leptospira levettii TaxID=2023178 RepID=UPI001082A67A|nr:phosphatase PAP2 family protein [Leptospira levettii]MCW7507074.1 phosphatase PAP2 family protein [Leptospira levettii]MCW7518164.1 phosphatase PAP2 family protein [Leptospira levettii]TGK99439.1 phosphatase PAP2 family protein [Leptospira levettii]TGL25792.1 phosphatase PAP2 family protein [Leptospira levettii]
MKELFLAETSPWFSSGPLDALHILDPSLGGIFFVISTICHYLGGSSFFLGLISFVYLYYRPKLAFELSLGLLTSGIAVSLWKFYLESPRPFPYPETFDEKAFGLPSGHVYSAIVVWGLLAYRIPKLWFRILSILIILFMPFSRMYLRVHYLGDVSLGFGLGILHLIIILLLLNKYYTNKAESFLFTNQYRTLGLLGIVLTLLPITLDSPFLTEEHHHSLSGVLMASGALGGFWLGILFYPRFSKKEFLDWSMPTINFQFGSDVFAVFWKTFFVRLSILVIVMALFYVIPGILIKQTVWKDDLFLRYIRYLVVSFALVCIVPIVLQKIQKGKFLQN